MHEPTRNQDTRVVYAPGGPRVNRYERERDAIVLDEALQEYPAAHDIVLEHELEHARQNHADASVFQHLKHEFRTDVLLYASTTDEAEAIREYLDAESDHGAGAAFWEAMDFLRQTWNMVLMPCGYCYRRFRGVR